MAGQRSLSIVIGCMAIFAACDAAEAAGPFVNFFRAVRHSITHPEEKPRSHRKNHQQTNHAASRKVLSSRSSKKIVAAPPNHDNVRSASTASLTKKGNSGLPYGTPVPGKQGFVTSPFAPESGYIDARGFAPGTPVKDPYSGKIFLNP